GHRAGRHAGGSDGPAGESDASGRETGVCGLRHRYVRYKGGHVAADGGSLPIIAGFENMRTRSFLWAIIMAAGFIYVTSHGDWSLRRIFQPFGPAARLWSSPEVAGAAAFGADEQNNIDVYRTANAATVNISSIVYREN